MAKVFRNSYIEFQYPDDWACHQERKMWICLSANSNQMEEVLAIIAKKEDSQKSIEQLKSYYNQAISVVEANGKKTLSEIVSPVTEFQNRGQTWYTGLHLGSEMAGYYTQYFFTTKSDLSVLLSLNIKKMDFTTKESLIKSLKDSLYLIAPADLLQLPKQVSLSMGNTTTLSDPTKASFSMSTKESATNKFSKIYVVWGFFLILGAGLLYYFGFVRKS